MALSIPLKVARKLVKWHFTSRALAKRAQELETADQIPLLSRFSGAERFDASRRVMDAALMIHLRTATEKEGAAIIERYLMRSHEEYVMAHEHLAAIPATRADIAALSLILRELALTFDTEKASFRLSCAAEAESREKEMTKRFEEQQKIISAVEQGVAALLAQATEAIASQQARLDSELDRMRTAERLLTLRLYALVTASTLLCIVMSLITYWGNR